MEKLFGKTLLPLLSFRKSKYLPPIVGTLSTIMVKKSGIGIQDPVTSANNKCLSLIHASSELIDSITGERENIPTPITFWRSGRKGVMKEKTGMTPTKPNSRA